MTTVGNLLYIDLVKENAVDFGKKLIEVANNLGINPDWLMLVFYIETGASVSKEISHKARNGKTNATGLIQFMPATARGLGTTVDKLREMSNIEQLDYVEKYLRPYKGKMKSLVDCYLAVFFPAAIGKPSNWVLETKSLLAATVARYNPLYDTNKDGKITVGEIEKKLREFVPKGVEL